MEYGCQQLLVNPHAHNAWDLQIRWSCKRMEPLSKCPSAILSQHILSIHSLHYYITICMKPQAPQDIHKLLIPNRFSILKLGFIVHPPSECVDIASESRWHR
mmetsp:Transcript_19266/g.53739  ORF Transcript_19266/g.53739 Transcript_19266/m.53739 type:complete len:102 (+) Transcript_19266:87-392(+)